MPGFKRRGGLSAFALFLASVMTAATLAGCRTGFLTGEEPSPTDVISTGDTISSSDAVLDSDEPISPTDTVYYTEVHIDGLILPEEYGAGLFDPAAVVWLTNEYRRQNGLPELLRNDPDLRRVTMLRLEETLQKFDHERPDGTRFFTAYDELGVAYAHCGENLAYGQFTAEEVVRDWIESETHREILLDNDAMYICAGTDIGEDGYAVWVLEIYSRA